MKLLFTTVIISLLNFTTVLDLLSHGCNRGGVYELTLKYQNAPKGSISEYKKYFLLFENPESQGKVTLYELLPVKFNTPVFAKGGITEVENQHFVIGYHCDHHWNGKEIILPQASHKLQDRITEGNESFVISTFVNKLRRADEGVEYGMVCPLTLYFYGKDFSNNDAINIRQDNNGFMPLFENKVINVNKAIIYSSIRKMSWSEDYINSLYNLSNLINQRWNFLVKRLNIISEVDDYDMHNLDHSGTDSELLESIRKIKNSCSNSNIYGGGENEYESESLYNDLFIGKIYGGTGLIDSNNLCFGAKQILEGFNNGYNYGKPIIMDMLTGSDNNFTVIQSELKKLVTKQQFALNQIATQKKIIEEYKSLVNEFSKFRDSLQKFENVLYPINKKHTIFQLNDSSNKPNIHLYDNVTLVFSNAEAPWNTTIKNLKSNLYTWYSSALSNYNYFRFGSDSVNINSKYEAINSIRSTNQLFRDTLEKWKTNRLEIIEKLNVDSRIDKLLSRTESSTEQLPKYIEKNYIKISYYDSCKTDCNYIIELNRSIVEFIEYIKKRIVWNADYQLKYANEYIKEKHNTMPDYLKNYLQNDKEKGSKIVANLFVLNSKLLDMKEDKYLEFIDDADISDRLEELYNLDNGDIDDAIEEIVKSKSFTIDEFVTENALGYFFTGQDLYSKIEEILDGCSEQLSKEEKKLIIFKSDSSKVKYLIDKFNEIPTYNPKYNISSIVDKSNIPNSKYTQICTFLSNYNLSRGMQEDLFEPGNLRSEFVNAYKSVYGNFNLFKSGSWINIITYNPVFKQWNILTYDSYNSNTSCIGIGKVVAFGFDCETNKINLGSVYVGGTPVVKW